MTQHKRNILVGITMIVALALLATMLILFSDAPFRIFAKPELHITLEAATSEGISEGSPIYYRGVNVGRVVRLLRNEDQTKVLIECVVDNDPAPPGNVEAGVRTTLFGGTGSIVLILPTMPQTVETPAGPVEKVMEVRPAGNLTANQKVPTRFIGVDVLPREITSLADDLRLSSQEFRRFIAEFHEAKFLEQAKSNLESLQRALDAATKTFETADSLMRDEKMRSNLAQSMENIRIATDSFVHVSKDLETLTANANKRLDELAANGNNLLVSTREQVEARSKQIGQSLEKVAAAVDNIEQVTRKVNEGKGTAGQMVNDPRLYDDLVDVSKELKLTIVDLRRMIEQWEKKGFQ